MICWRRKVPVKQKQTGKRCKTIQSNFIATKRKVWIQRTWKFSWKSLKLILVSILISFQRHSTVGHWFWCKFSFKKESFNELSLNSNRLFKKSRLLKDGRGSLRNSSQDRRRVFVPTSLSSRHGANWVAPSPPYGINGQVALMIGNQPTFPGTNHASFEMESSKTELIYDKIKL